MRPSAGQGGMLGLFAGWTKGEVLHVQRVDAPLAYPLPLDLFDDLGAGIFVIDPRGDLIEVNRAGADMLGYTQEELVGKNVATFMHPEDLADCASPAGLSPSRPLAWRRRLRHKDGEYRMTDGRAR